MNYFGRSASAYIYYGRDPESGALYGFTNAQDALGWLDGLEEKGVEGKIYLAGNTVIDPEDTVIPWLRETF